MFCHVKFGPRTIFVLSNHKLIITVKFGPPGPILTPDRIDVTGHVRFGVAVSTLLKSMEEEEADWGSAWTVVGGRSARHQQVPLSGIAKGSRVGVSHEASVRSQGVWIKGHHRPSSPPLHLVPESVKLQEDGLDHATKECTVNKPDLSHLIGAPVFVGGAKPARDTAPPPASRRPAGLLKVDMRMVTGRGGGEEDQRREEPFDLSAENWPGIGVEGGGGRGVVGDVTSYSRVVKTAPPTRQRPPPNHNVSDCNGEGKGLIKAPNG